MAESPPKSEDKRFFYNPHQVKYDFLFKSIMEVLFPDFKNNYQRVQKQKHKYLQKLKREYLQKFKEQGFYLIDAIDTPINDRNQKERNKIIRENLKNKIKGIGELISKDTPIILIKKNVFEILYPELKKRGFNVVHSEYIPFPSSGHQREFKEKFKLCLERVSDQYMGNGR